MTFIYGNKQMYLLLTRLDEKIHFNSSYVNGLVTGVRYMDTGIITRDRYYGVFGHVDTGSNDEPI